MRAIARGGLIACALLLTAGCAGREDWNMWLSHNTHFASGGHGIFSIRNNKDGSDPRVTRSDIEAARRENWWGVYAVNVTPSQIFQD